jgi:hypothetical protein
VEPKGSTRRESLGFVHRSRAIFCRPVPSPNVTIRYQAMLNENLDSLKVYVNALDDKVKAVPPHKNPTPA